VVAPLLGYASAVFRGQAYTFDRTQQQYAAEAAIRRVMADLVMGADAIPTTYNTYSPYKPGKPYTSLVFHKRLYNERACQEWLWRTLSTPTV